MKQSQFKGIPVQEARATTVNATLKIGQVSESVEVTATPLLNATDATNGYTLDSAQIDMTPLATGSFTQVAVLVAWRECGTASRTSIPTPDWGNQPIWANGQRDTSNTFQVNGVDSTNLFNGKSSSRFQLTALQLQHRQRCLPSADHFPLAHRFMVQTETACRRLRLSSRRSCA